MMHFKKINILSRLKPAEVDLVMTLVGVTGQIAVVSEKIHICLSTEPVQNVITPLPLDTDLDPLDVDTQTLKVTQHDTNQWLDICDSLFVCDCMCMSTLYLQCWYNWHIRKYP